MSDRAYACVTAFPSSWARASSLAAQSALFSSAQERKVALKPCRVVSSPAVRKASAIVLWWMIWPLRDGNTRSFGCGQRSRFFEYCEGCCRERDAVRATHLRPLGWDRPQRVVEVDLSPSCAASLIRAGPCQDGESDGEGGRGVRGLEIGEGGGCFMGRRGGEVPGEASARLFRFSDRKRSCPVVVFPYIVPLG